MSSRKSKAANGLKKHNQQAHAINRLKERYNLKVTVADYKHLCYLIKSNTGATTPLTKISNRLTIHLVPYRGDELILLYDKIRHQIVTALPREAKEKYADRYETSENAQCLL